MIEYIVKETGYPGTLSQEVVCELIRCKDCKHAEKWTDADGDFIACHIKDDICDYIDYVEPMHYCGYAERG